MPYNIGKRARTEAILGELAELGLILARDLAVRARVTEDVTEKVSLSHAFQKMSRDVRLSLALAVKLDRDAARDAAGASFTDVPIEALAGEVRAKLRLSRDVTAANDPPLLPPPRSGGKGTAH